MCFICSSISWTWLRKESVSLKELSKLKYKDKKEWGGEGDQKTQELWDNFKRYNIGIIGIAEGVEKVKNIFEIIMVKIFPTLITDPESSERPSSINTCKCAHRFTTFKVY